MENSLFIYDFIGASVWETGVTDKSFRDELQKYKNGEPITVRINSPGGSVAMAVAIKTMLDQWKGEVTIQIDGMAASAASFIAMAGQKSVIAEASEFMIHDPWTIVSGDSKYLRKTADRMDETATALAKVYAERSGKTVKEIADMMSEETWFTASEAVQHGFVDEVIAVEAMACAIPESFGFKHPPATPEPPKQRNVNRIAAMQRQVDLARAI